MTPEQVQEALRRIEKVASNGDNEHAHMLQDQLLREFVTACARNESWTPTLVAREVVKVYEIPFSRWYA